MPHKKQAWSKRVRKDAFKKRLVTRMQATRMLQVDSIQFRRLCILKGIYPRALNKSKQKQSGNEKQYYLAREIKWLMRDHLAEKMMAHRAWEKKMKRAEAMNKPDEIKILQSKAVKPSHNLVPTIKERYPYFIDAVKDIDDAMSMISLYAFLSPEVNSSTTIETHHALTSGLHRRAQEICQQWNDYVIKAKNLSKGFISIKGYYYEAIVKGERIRWLCPHEYAHKFPSGIQQYVMLSFLEFYVELMKFILYKLNSELKRDLEERAQIEEEGVNTNVEDFHATADELDVETKNRQMIKQSNDKNSMIAKELAKVREIFNGLTFYVSREVPAKHIRLVVESAGGRMATEYVPANITHMVIDRPALPPGMKKEEHIEYVQPQYVFDCLNARTLLPVQGYRIGEDLPPHVSPFTVAISNAPEDIAAVEDVKKNHPKLVGYVPQRVHEIRKTINPNYTSIDPDGKLAKLEEDWSDDENHVQMAELDRDADVALSDDELREAREGTAWEDEKVKENVARSKLSAFKVKKQRELNLMNAPTDEVTARRRQAILRKKEEARKNESEESRLKRKVAQAKKEDAATKKMQLQVARKKAARYYKMVNNVVQGVEKKAQQLATKAKHIEEGKLQKTEDGKGLVNSRLKAKRERAESKGQKLKEKKKNSNPYKKLPKWVQ